MRQRLTVPTLWLAYFLTTAACGRGESQPPSTSVDAPPTIDAPWPNLSLVEDCEQSQDCLGASCLSIPTSENEGWKTCVTAVSEATTASNPAADECIVSADCAAPAKCIKVQDCQENTVPTNRCLADECQQDIDCTAEGPFPFCLPAGAFASPVNVCRSGDCLLDTDCSEFPDGKCSPFFDGCSGLFNRFSCTYAFSDCRHDQHCPQDLNQQCAITEPGGITACQPR